MRVRDLGDGKKEWTYANGCKSTNYNEVNKKEQIY